MNNFKFRHRILSILTDINIIGIRAIVNHLPKILIPKPVKIVTIETIYGFRMEIDPVKDVAVERSLYYTGTYEKGTLFIMKNVLFEGHVFVDVGANIGLMSIFASQIVGNSGRVFAFEPNPNTNNILQRNIELNNISNIEISKYAIGNVKKTGKIYDNWYSGRGSSSLIQPNQLSESYDIDVVTLSEFFNGGQQVVNLIKFDIEGYELPALQGAKDLIEKTGAILIIESSDMRENFKNSNRDDIFNFVKELKKYRLFKLTGSKNRVSRLEEIFKANKMPQHDNIFCFTQEHIERVPGRIFKTSPAKNKRH